MTYLLNNILCPLIPAYSAGLTEPDVLTALEQAIPSAPAIVLHRDVCRFV